MARASRRGFRDDPLLPRAIMRAIFHATPARVLGGSRCRLDAQPSSSISRLSSPPYTFSAEIRYRNFIVTNLIISHRCVSLRTPPRSRPVRNEASETFRGESGGIIARGRRRASCGALVRVRYNYAWLNYIGTYIHWRTEVGRDTVTRYTRRAREAYAKAARFCLALASQPASQPARHPASQPTNQAVNHSASQAATAFLFVTKNGACETRFPVNDPHRRNESRTRASSSRTPRRASPRRAAPRLAVLSATTRIPVTHTA